MSISEGERDDTAANEADDDDPRDFSLRQAKSNEAATPLMQLVTTFVRTAASLRIQPTEADFSQLLEVWCSLAFCDSHASGLHATDAMLWCQRQHSHTSKQSDISSS